MVCPPLFLVPATKHFLTSHAAMVLRRVLGGMMGRCMHLQGEQGMQGETDSTLSMD